MLCNIDTLFRDMGIEFFGALNYKHCREINPRLVDKLGFSPRSVIVFLLPYYVSPTKNLSVYAASIDYHLIIKELGAVILPRLEEAFPAHSFALYGDHSPIDERHAALCAGVGVLGENGLIINEKYGTYVFIADIISDVPAESLGAFFPKEIRTCERCGRCKSACPTGFLLGRDDFCLSAITQKRGELSDKEIAVMRSADTVWGCDVCQRVCPHNKDPVRTPISAFYRNRIEQITTEDVEAMDDDEFLLRAFSWRGRKTILRNLSYLGY